MCMLLVHVRKCMWQSHDSSSHAQRELKFCGLAIHHQTKSESHLWQPKLAWGTTCEWRHSTLDVIIWITHNFRLSVVQLLCKAQSPRKQQEMKQTHFSWKEGEGEARWLLVEAGNFTRSGVKLQGYAVQGITLHHLKRSEVKGQSTLVIVTLIPPGYILRGLKMRQPV